MKMEHVQLIVGVFHLRVGADVNKRVFHLRSLNKSPADTIARPLMCDSKGHERGSDIRSKKKVGGNSTVARVEELNRIHGQLYIISVTS